MQKLVRQTTLSLAAYTKIAQLRRVVADHLTIDRETYALGQVFSPAPDTASLAHLRLFHQDQERVAVRVLDFPKHLDAGTS